MLDDPRWLGPPRPDPKPLPCRCGAMMHHTLATDILQRTGNRFIAVIEGECERCGLESEAAKLRRLVANQNVFPHMRADYASRLRKLERELKGRVA